MHTDPSSELPRDVRDGGPGIGTSSTADAAGESRSNQASRDDGGPRRPRFLFVRGIDFARLTRFGMVSVITTFVDFAIFNLLVIPKLLPPLVATTISYTCGIVASFVLNKWFTFRGGRDSLVHEFGLFVGINVVGLGLNNGAVALVEHVAGGGTLLLNMAKLGAGALTWVLKFLTFKHWVFPVREPVTAGWTKAGAEAPDQRPTTEGRTC
ncbi:MAG TPA: GtrA family protein [Actinomycetota bacterium]